ncbi:MAG TPA: hypothetical protein VGI71_23785 [Scandinavium sp.]|jgi:hypothetical protein
MKQTAPQQTEQDETAAVSTKRQVTAVVATTAVTVALGLAANVLISKIAGRVHDAIIPEDKNDSEE